MNTTPKRFEENWSDVYEYEGIYKVSDLGRIKSVRNGIEKLLKMPIHRTGYVKICLHKNGKQHTLLLHRIVATAFLVNPENKPQVNHINGCKSDNRVSNLEWNTAKENTLHLFEVLNKVNPEGVDHPMAKLSENQVIDIYNSSDTYRSLATKYNVSPGLIGDIRRGKAWKSLTGDLPKNTLKDRVLEAKKSRQQKVEQWTLEGQFVAQYESGSQAEKIGFDRSRISMCVRGLSSSHKGFIWKYSTVNI